MEDICLVVAGIQVTTIAYSCIVLSGANVHAKFTIPFIMAAFSLTIRHTSKTYPIYMPYFALVVVAITTITTLERQILLSPEQLTIPVR